MRNATRPLRRQVRHTARSWRLALAALILAASLTSCSSGGGWGPSWIDRALTEARAVGDRFDATAERWVAPLRDSLQGMARVSEGIFDRITGRLRQ